VNKTKPRRFLRVDGIAHKDVHERRRRPNRARQPLRAAGARDKSQVGLRQSDQVVAILGDTEIAGKRELESASPNTFRKWLRLLVLACSRREP